ncbi:hypothetical protein FPK49_30470, partial [Acinetobacter baumannii]|nr:hypothetical protein [Acinetobacter baumannii]
LNQYVERLHHRHRNGLTIYDAIGKVVDGTDVPAIELYWADANAHDPRQLDHLRDLAERLEVNAAAVGSSDLVEGPLT